MKYLIVLIISAVFTCAHGATPPEADRRAILEMAGKFEVHFHFQETLALKTGYALKGADDSDAHELVVVAQDTGDRISLQHLLVVGNDKVVHHWRQIWTFEDTRINEFRGHNTWAVRTLSPEEVRGTWSQLVTQVDNSPRYESWGRWSHEGGAAKWTSKETWRPLPRREYTKRQDYDVLMGVNTHMIMANGWAHEQSNTKLDLLPSGSKAIAREAGLNTYVRNDAFNFEPAMKFWSANGEFSNAVAATWDDLMAKEDKYRLEDDIEVSGLRDEIEALQKEKVPIPEVRERAYAVIMKYLRKDTPVANP